MLVMYSRLLSDLREKKKYTVYEIIISLEEFSPGQMSKQWTNFIFSEIELIFHKSGPEN